MRNKFKLLCNIIPSPKINKILEDSIRYLDLISAQSKLWPGQEMFRKNKSEALQIQIW